jgi:hypothetical protein
MKVGADIVCVGDAVAPAPSAAIDVALRVRDRTVSLRVHGPRVYYQDLRHVAVGPAAPVDRVPIVYELAYGGASQDYALVERRNPSGRGVARKTSELVGKPAPQIEDPNEPVVRAGHAYQPAGFGALPSHWSPRSDYAGTFDERWQQDRMPLMPRDFNPLHYNVAHPKLVLETPLEPGDAVGAAGLTPEPLAFRLPDLGLVLDARRDDGSLEVVSPPVDTLLLEPEARRVELVARYAFVEGRAGKRLTEIRAELRGARI